MKQNWEYKKLGEVALTINGLWTGKKPPFITVPVISLKNFTKDCKLKKEDYSIIDVEVRHYESRKLKYGDIIIEKSGGSDTQPVGRPILFDIKEGDYSFSNFTATLRVNDIYREQLNAFFLHYILLSYYNQGKTFNLQSKTTGIHNLDLKGYLDFTIPVPPLSTQTAIVSELDTLSAIIADHKSLLKKYDELEQSIFYDMFGDPVKNEKGWEVKKLGEISNMKAGKAIKANELLESPVNGLYPCYGGNGIRGFIAKKSHNGCYPIIGRQGALCGNVKLAKGEFYATEHAVVVNKKDIDYDCYWLFYMLTLLNLNQYSHGQAQPGISVNTLEKVCIPLPPLPLQQEFASKIEAIEAMKADTKKSLAKSEELFNARMDYYFNA